MMSSMPTCSIDYELEAHHTCSQGLPHETKEKRMQKLLACRTGTGGELQKEEEVPSLAVNTQVGMRSRSCILSGRVQLWQ